MPSGIFEGRDMRKMIPIAVLFFITGPVTAVHANDHVVAENAAVDARLWVVNTTGLINDASAGVNSVNDRPGKKLSLGRHTANAHGREISGNPPGPCNDVENTQGTTSELGNY